MSFALVLLAVAVVSAAVLLYQYWSGAMLDEQPGATNATPQPPTRIVPGNRIDHAA